MGLSTRFLKSPIRSIPPRLAAYTIGGSPDGLTGWRKRSLPERRVYGSFHPVPRLLETRIPRRS